MSPSHWTGVTISQYRASGFTSTICPSYFSNSRLGRVYSWFLNDSDPDWSPPPQLLEWMAQARRDGKPIVYIGFGSITIPHPNRVQARLINAIVQSTSTAFLPHSLYSRVSVGDVRAIMSKGWSDRSYDGTSDRDPKVTIPPQCYTVDKVPHDWLFSRIDAALHHGGAGTTAASLRAGIPTLIKPWFGDQYFWAARVQKLGVSNDMRFVCLSPRSLTIVGGRWD